MSPTRDVGFVLRTWPLREADAIVALFTREHGKVRGVAHRATRPKGPWLGALEPMTLISVHWTDREGRDLVSLREPTIERTPHGREPDLARIWTLAHVAEIVDAVGQERDADDALFRLCSSLVDALEVGQPPALVARYAELWALRLQGVLPDLERCAGCGEALEAEGGTWSWQLSGLGCPTCVPGDGIGPVAWPEDLAWAHSLLRVPPRTAEDPGPVTLRRLGVLFGRMLAELLGRELRTASFLRELDRLD